MAKSAQGSEALLRLVNNLKSGEGDDLEHLKRDLGHDLEASLQKVLVDGVRRIHEQGDDVQPKTAAFVNQVLGIAASLGADVNKLASQAIAALADPAAGTRAVKKQDTRSLILDAALDVFSEDGFHQTTMDQIAEKAGLGKGTLYRYFPTKDALYHALFLEKWNGLIQATRSEFQRHDNVIEAMRAGTRAYLVFFESNARLCRLLLKEPLAAEQEMREQYMAALLNEIPAIRSHFIADTGSGRFKPHNFYTVFYGYMGFVEGVIQKWLRNDSKHSLVNELDVILDTVLFGFVAENAPDRNPHA